MQTNLVRNAIKEHVDRHRKVLKKEETEYEYSGSEDDELQIANNLDRVANNFRSLSYSLCKYIKIFDFII